jgi:hypothetical protein
MGAAGGRPRRKNLGNSGGGSSDIRTRGFSLERAVTRPATTGTYGVVATDGCHGQLVRSTQDARNYNARLMTLGVSTLAQTRRMDRRVRGSATHLRNVRETAAQQRYWCFVHRSTPGVRPGGTPPALLRGASLSAGHLFDLSEPHHRRPCERRRQLRRRRQSRCLSAGQLRPPP